VGYVLEAQNPQTAKMSSERAETVTDEEHLSSDLLLRFLLGEAADGEGALIVRHLLRGCEPCRRLAWQAWFPERVSVSEKEKGFMNRRYCSIGED
jgi:hypothetical protein